MAAFIKDPAAAAAFQEGLSPLDGNQRDEEKADIVVKAFEPGRRQAAPGTTSGLVVHLNLLGLYPPDEKEEDPPPGINSCNSKNFLSRLLPAIYTSLFECFEEFNGHRELCLKTP